MPKSGAAPDGSSEVFGRRWRRWCLSWCTQRKTKDAVALNRSTFLSAALLLLLWSRSCRVQPSAGPALVSLPRPSRFCLACVSRFCSETRGSMFGYLSEVDAVCGWPLLLLSKTDSESACMSPVACFRSGCVSMARPRSGRQWSCRSRRPCRCGIRVTL